MPLTDFSYKTSIVVQDVDGAKEHVHVEMKWRVAIEWQWFTYDGTAKVGVFGPLHLHYRIEKSICEAVWSSANYFYTRPGINKAG